MRELEFVLLVGVLLLGIVIWAMILTTHPETSDTPTGPVGILWHTATPITDWTPHTSTVLR